MRTLLLILRSIRPRQWTKNLFVFAAILFSRNVFKPDMLLRTIAAFGVFCLVSGAVYLLNDLLDRERDRLHPVKCRRPIASGELTAGLGVAALVVLSVLALGASYPLGVPLLYCTAAYLGLQVAYSTVLKNVVIVDVFALSLGFVLRVVAGAEVISVEISRWLFICTILLALFLALNKRRHEIVTMAHEAGNHRKVLAEYSPYLLDQMISVVTASTVVAYALYTMAAETVTKFGTQNLVFTVPFVIYGIFRYLYLVHHKKEGGSPELTLITDLPLLAGVFLWAAAVGVILYL